MAVFDEFEPEMVGFSTTSNQYRHVKQVATMFKERRDVPIVCGGIHPTIASEDVLSHPAIDMVCQGEGELAMLELAYELANGSNLDIANIWSKTNGTIRSSPTRPLVANLDELPFPDREGFDFAGILAKKRGWANLMAGRGCHYQCTYCVNNYFHKVYSAVSSRRSHLRIRSVDTVLREVEYLSSSFRVKLLNFDDDIFTMDKEWLREFCDKYAARFKKMPFACNIRVNMFDREIATMIRSAGCVEVKIGLESGSERVRSRVLKRHTPEAMIRRAFGLAEELGIRAWAFNMIGVPTETPEDVMETVRLNAQIRPYILRCSIFYPYQGTDLYEHAEQHGLMDHSKDEAYSNHLDGSVLNLPQFPPARIMRFKHMFKWYVDANSDIEAAPLFQSLVAQFEQLPDEYWLDGRAEKMVNTIDRQLDKMLRASKKEHYASRKHLDLKYCEQLHWKLP
jgi:radical SAM superfamily enzyme YgiQ (UPF0313 family)